MKPDSLQPPQPQTIVSVGRPVGIRAEALVTIMFPQDTFVPRCLRGVASAITEEGMDWLTFQLSPEQIHMLQSEQHFARVALDLADAAGAIRLRSAVVSVNYQLRTSIDPAQVTLRLRFIEEGGVDGLLRLREALERVRASSYNTGPLRPHLLVKR